MSNDIEYYEFTYKIPKYKIKPPLNFCKYYQIHKDEIIIDLQQENKQLTSILTELEEWLNKEILDGRSKDHLWLQGCYDEDKLILDKMQELKEKYK